MINKVVITNYLKESIELDLYHPEKTGIAILHIDGIAGSKADINFIQTSTQDGGRYNSSRVGPRNIVFGLQFLWVNTVEEARHRMYKYFPIKKKVAITFYTDTRDLQIQGYIEANEVNIFEKDVVGQISIMCPNPHFYDIHDLARQNIIFSNSEPNFEFPFENASLEEKLLEFGIISTVYEKNIKYAGDIETGVYFTVYINGAVKNLTFFNRSTDQVMALDTSRLKPIVNTTEFQNGDLIIVNTIRGERSISLYRNSKSYSILSCLKKNTDWINLVPGDNRLVYVAESGVENATLVLNNLVYYQGV